jgi:putative transposase
MDEVPDGGGLTAKERAKRAAVRLEAASLLEQGVAVPQIAAQLAAIIAAEEGGDPARAAFS